MSFVHPALLLGTLLFAVPLIIHLLNRQRFRKREWAAMEFLLRAYRKQRRRLRTENLLLLILRCLIPIILAMAIARPVLRDALGGALGGSAHHVLVLDQSYSMGFEPEQQQSPHAVMMELAAELVDRLEEGDDKVTIVLAGMHTTFPVQGELDLGKVRDRIARIGAPQDSGQDLVDSLTQVADMVEDGVEGETVVYVFTDMQLRAFGHDPDEEAVKPVDPAAIPGEGEGDPSAPPTDEMFEDTARDLFARLGERAKVVILDVGRLANDIAVAQADNVQITDLKLDTTLAFPRTPVPMVATLANRSKSARDVQVTLDVEGEQPQIKGIRLEAGAEGQVEFSVIFRREGQRHVRVATEGDGLDADNARFLVIDVRPRLRVLIVEGSDETDEGLMDSELLRSRLDPTRGEGPPSVTTFAPRVIDTVQFLSGNEDLRNQDIIALCNVERLSESAARGIQDAMLGGTALWVMFGDRVDPASYNLHLHGADGPMPMRLVDVRGYEPMGQQAYEAEINASDHPIFQQAFIEDVYHRAFELTPIYRYVAAEMDEQRAGAQVLARVRDQWQSPLLVSSRLGAGKAVFMTSGLSDRPDRWNRLDVQIMSFPLTHEVAKWLTLPSSDPFNVATGAELTTTLDRNPTEVAVLLPERAGGGKVLVGEQSQRRPGGLFTLPAFRRTDYAGVYTVETRLIGDGDSTSKQLFFAANADPGEGDLSYLSHAAAQEQLGIKTILRRLPNDSSAALNSGISDFGLPLLWAALIAVLGEAVLARFVSRRRS